MAIPKQHYATSSLVIWYALCSSLLDVINKFAITKFNYPWLLTALGVWVLGNLGSLTPLLVVVFERHHQPPPVQTSLPVSSLMNEKTMRLPTMRARREKAMEIFRSGNDGVGKMMP
ncbi:hypothetical protein R6Q57_001886 [Mikania cordata]